jgi:short-subunit dehydrogenase
MSLNAPVHQWKGQRVWIIGASSGIGRATAVLLHRLGAKVLVSARNQTALLDLSLECPGMQVYPMDITDTQQIQRVSLDIMAKGAVHRLCICSGHYEAVDIPTWNAETIEQHMMINFLGPAKLLQFMTPFLLRQAGANIPTHVSLVSSIAASRGLPKALAYGPSKAALSHFTEVLYQELKDKGIGVSLIHPGFVDTRLTQKNAFHMPALLTPNDAAQAIVKGWERGRFEIDFPRRFTVTLKLLRLLPYALYFPLVKRITEPSA